MKKNHFFLLLLCCPLFVKAQKTDKERALVQVSGVVMSNDSLRPVFFATILIKGTNRGTISTADGYFSIAVPKGDTLHFSAIGYERSRLLVPLSYETEVMTVVHFMQRDTLLLPEAVIYPWPKPEEFEEAFMNVKVPDDDLKRAKRNLNREHLRELGEALAMDGSENYSYQMRQYSQQQYYSGQYPPMNILNPFAWAKFFKALKTGILKIKTRGRTRTNTAKRKISGDRMKKHLMIINLTRIASQSKKGQVPAIHDKRRIFFSNSQYGHFKCVAQAQFVEIVAKRPKRASLRYYFREVSPK